MARPLLALLLLGLALAGFTVVGVFTIDEPHQIAALAGLLDGGYYLAPTQGLPPAPQLWFFKPGVAVAASPATSVQPPLWAFFAAPFHALFGLRGLFLLNTTAFLATVAMVFAYAKRHASKPETPWLAAGAFAFGGFAIEYAMGLWPHMLSVALVVGAGLAAERARRSGRAVLWGLLAGALVGLAAGVRYQNVIVAGVLGLTLVVWSKRRAPAVIAYAGGAALPLLASASINAARIGVFNPISKGKSYLSFGGPQRPWEAFDVVRSFWMRTVDFTVRPAGKVMGEVMTPEPASGAYVIFGEVKKALLQSAPWLVVALVASLWAWRRRDEGTNREIRVASLVIWALLAGFAATGLTRTDGVCFNQRYFHELIPFAALAFAWSLEKASWKGDAFVIACAGGAALGALVGWGLPSPWRETAIVRLPLVLAALALVTWTLGRDRRRWLGVTLGLCLGWAAALHSTDVAASVARRSQQASVTDEARQLLPADAPYAVFGTLDVTHALAPLLLEHDVVVLDAGRGGPDETRALLAALFAERRRVFVIANNSSRGFLLFVTQGRRVRESRAGHMVMLELLCTPGSDPCPES